MESVVCGSDMFASKNSGSTSSAGSSLVSATKPLILSLVLSLLMRTCGNIISITFQAEQDPDSSARVPVPVP